LLQFFVQLQTELQSGAWRKWQSDHDDDGEQQHKDNNNLEQQYRK
jgi:hypothetical protein